jgi:MFS family permease
MIFFCLPETLARREPATPETHPQKTNKGVMVLKRIVDPLKILAYLRYPPILVAVYSGSIAFGALFVINISIQASFSYTPYNFSVIEVGLLYLAPTLGYALASVLGGRWIDYIMKREARRAGRFDEDGKPKYLPEDRMKENIYIAATLYPAALIWFGWSVDKGLPWIVSSIAAFFFGIGCSPSAPSPPC